MLKTASLKSYTWTAALLLSCILGIFFNYANPVLRAAEGDLVSQEPASLEPAQTMPEVLPAELPKQEKQSSKNPSQPKKPLKLFGRIEEISSTPGAVLPLKLKPQNARMDLSRSLPKASLPGRSLSSSVNQQTYSGRITAVERVRSFPVSWRGIWNGTLKIHSCQFDRIRWDFDPVEAEKEKSLLQPGLIGQVSFNFMQEPGGQIALEPSQVVFTSTMDSSQYAEVWNKMLGPQSQASPFRDIFGGQQGSSSPFAMLKKMPYMYAMHLGNLRSGTGVTGNELQSKLMKNDLKQLREDTLEQVVVTYDRDHNPKTGRVRQSYSESVLRFTRINSQQLYVQAATVNYRNDGKFENKILLYGTVNRGRSTGNYAGFGDLNGLQQLFQQLQTGQ